MAVEQAHIHIIPKPWGRTDLRPWNAYHDPLAAIGEVWFERADPSAPVPTLLLKLIFTDESLSIQVHPDEALARRLRLDVRIWGRGVGVGGYHHRREPRAQETSAAGSVHPIKFLR